MRGRGPPFIMRLLGLAAALVLIGTVASGEEPAGYAPVAPAAAAHAAVRSNIKAVRNWIDDKDYISAADASRSLSLVVQLYGYQNGSAEWRKQIVALQE